MKYQASAAAPPAPAGIHPTEPADKVDSAVKEHCRSRPSDLRCRRSAPVAR